MNKDKQYIKIGLAFFPFVNPYLEFFDENHKFSKDSPLSIDVDGDEININIYIKDLYQEGVYLKIKDALESYDKDQEYIDAYCRSIETKIPKEKIIQ